MSSHFGWRTSHRVDMWSIAPQCGRRLVRFELTEQTRQAIDDYTKSLAETVRISVQRPWPSQPLDDDPAICSARLELGCNDRHRPALFRDTRPSTYQSGTHLPSNR